MPRAPGSRRLHRSVGHAHPPVLALVNNHISLTMLQADLSAKGIDTHEVGLVALRRLESDCSDFAYVLEHPGTRSLASSSAWWAWRISEFYVRASRLVRSAVDSDNIRFAYVVNQDNVLCRHIISKAGASVEVTVLAEGLMNFFDVVPESIAASRGLVKSLMACVLRLHYSAPVGHLSGSFLDRTDRVVSFASEGLAAPQAKVTVHPWPGKCSSVPSNKRRAALLLHTGLCEMMSKNDYLRFATDFAAWLQSQGFREVLQKRHPRKPDPVIESLLEGFPGRFIGDGPIEAQICDLDIDAVISFGSTALLTAKLMRPELKVLDVGGNRYVPAVYGSGPGAKPLFDSVGVKSVDL